MRKIPTIRTNARERGWRKRPLGCDCSLKPWLVDEGSLTQRIQSCCRRFGLKLLAQKFDLPCRDERSCAGLRAAESYLVREVSLQCGRVPVVFAHSVIGRRAHRGAWRLVAALGAKSLGTALFARAGAKRYGVAFRCLRRTDALYARAAGLLPRPPVRLWARRSLFLLQGARIAVTEVFLPGIVTLDHDAH